jgi:hypothetical protein
MTGQGPWRHDRGMDLPAPLAWLVDEAGASPGPDRFLAEFGGRLLADGLPLAGGALTLGGRAESHYNLDCSEFVGAVSWLDSRLHQ